jgi:hypothetical protein
MTYADERDKIGREPLHICELDADFCHVAYEPTEKTILEFDPNLLKYSESLLNAAWVKDAQITLVQDDVVAKTAEVTDNFKATDDGTIASARVYQTIPGGTLTTNAAERLSFYVKFGDSTAFTIGLYDTTAAAWRARIDFNAGGGGITLKAADVGNWGITSKSNGWYRCWARVPINQIIGANEHICVFYPTEEGVVEGASFFTYVSGGMLRENIDEHHYMLTLARDGSQTNILVATGMTLDEWIGESAFLGNATHTRYPIVDNTAQHIRVTGDATGEGIGVHAHIGGCPESGSGDTRCFGTRATCNATQFYDPEDKVYRHAEPRPNVPPSAATLSDIRSVSVDPSSATLGEGLGVRGKVKVSFQDAPDHDRLTDPFVGGRTYAPMSRGTYWGKWLARNLYRQNRTMRLKSGYIGTPFDLTNDFQTRSYLIDRVEGPNPQGLVTVTGLDALKMIDDSRAQCPTLTVATLVLDIDASTTGNRDVSPDTSELDASGTICIGSECMAYTKVDADTINITERGTDGSTAAEHDAGDNLQLCKRYTEKDILFILNDQLANYTDVPTAYLDTAGWAAEADDWLPANSASALITSPTGVREIIDELCVAFMFDLVWDEKSSLIRLKVVAPPTEDPPLFTDEDALLADSVEVKELHRLRVSRSWVYWGVIDPTASLTDPNNFLYRNIGIDPGSEGADQHGEKRVRDYFVRWFTNAGDATRLASRIPWRYRDNPLEIKFNLDAKLADDLLPGDVVAIETDAIQDATGARKNTWVRLTEVHEVVGGHMYACKGLDDKWTGRYARIAPAGMADYDAATEDQRRLYGWIGDASGEINGEEGYRIV